MMRTSAATARAMIPARTKAIRRNGRLAELCLCGHGWVCALSRHSTGLGGITGGSEFLEILCVEFGISAMGAYASGERHELWDAQGSKDPRSGKDSERLAAPLSVRSATETWSMISVDPHFGQDCHAFTVTTSRRGNGRLLWSGLTASR